LLSTPIMEDLELVWVCCGRRMPPTAHFILVPFSLEKLHWLWALFLEEFQWNPEWRFTLQVSEKIIKSLLYSV
jgi:hypothetical protein